MACPNKNTKEWKRLERQLGPDLALYTWKAYQGNFDKFHTNTKLRRELSIPYEAFPKPVINLSKRLRAYNLKNGTSHSFTLSVIGETQNRRVNLFINYLPVNIEKQRQRDANRSETGGVPVDFNNKDTFGIDIENDESIIPNSYNEVNDTYDIADMLVDTKLDHQKIQIKEGSEFIVDGELFNTMGDAIQALDDPDLSMDISNLQPTQVLMDYLYENSTKRLSKDNFTTEAKKIINLMKYKNPINDILDTIKCL